MEFILDEFDENNIDLNDKTFSNGDGVNNKFNKINSLSHPNSNNNYNVTPVFLSKEEREKIRKEQEKKLDEDKKKREMDNKEHKRNYLSGKYREESRDTKERKNYYRHSRSNSRDRNRRNKDYQKNDRSQTSDKKDKNVNLENKEIEAIKVNI